MTKHSRSPQGDDSASHGSSSQMAKETREVPGEMEDAGLTCIHCGQPLLVATAMNLYLGGNASYFCDPNDLSKAHEARLN